MVFVKSTKQKLVTCSSTESELLALADATKEVIYLRNLCRELDMPQQGPTAIAQDNKSCILMATRAELGSQRTKHFTQRHYFAKQSIDDNTIRLEFESGKSIKANFLTKPIPGLWGDEFLGSTKADPSASAGKHARA